jgi:hypothetical protein
MQKKLVGGNELAQNHRRDNPQPDAVWTIEEMLSATDDTLFLIAQTNAPLPTIRVIHQLSGGRFSPPKTHFSQQQSIFS